jgi:YfiH family protein
MIRTYFGGKNDPFLPLSYFKYLSDFNRIKKKLSAKSLTFLKQVHGVDGYCVEENKKSLSLFEREGDFLITNKPGCAIGVLTADCLPVVLHDAKNNACGVVHAGWRGGILGILPKAISSMQEKFGTRAQDLIAYFGPCAKCCCYSVGKDFYKNLSVCYVDSVISFKKDSFFFNNVMLNKLQLLEFGLFEKNIINLHNTCTICDRSYHSYRRDGKGSCRQATVVVLV